MNLNLQDMLQQAQKVQEEMERIREEAQKKTATADAGGGMVSVTANGAMQIINVKISKEAVDPNDVEMLEDLIVAATNKALQQAQNLVAEEMNKISGMLPNIPGLNLPF